MFSLDLLLNAIVAGILLGGFYAAVSLGVSGAFGILGSYTAYAMNRFFGVDPLLTGLLFTPVFYGLGVAMYRLYYAGLERKGEESLRGLVFFFGTLFIVEVALLLAYGVDYRMIEARYVGQSFHIGVVGVAFRLLLPCLVGLLVTVAL